MSAVLAIAGADAAERTRRFAFVVVIAAALYAGYLYVPEASSAYHTVIVHNHGGIYNSAFYGATIAALLDGFLSILGFFLVRGSIERDSECHVDGIVGASPVRKAAFVLGKWLSNAAVLWSVAGVAYVAAMAMEMIRSHSIAVDLLAYLMPYLLITVPAMAFVAAVAIVFDLVPFMRGVLGGIAFFVLWGFMLSAPVALRDGGSVQALDPVGFSVISSALLASEQRAFPYETSPDINFGIIMKKHIGAPFLFTGFNWTAAMVGQRLGWFAIAMLIVIAFSPLFDRFRREGVRTNRSFFVDVSRLLPNVPALRLFRAEFSLVAGGANIWWYLGALGVIIAGAFVPIDAVTKIILPIALIWPLERISALGAREQRYGVGDIMASTPGFATKTLFFQWLAGTLVTVIVASSCIARIALAGDATSIVAGVAVAGAIAAAALALGSIFGVSRVFESVFVIAWYLGPIQHLADIDFAQGMVSAPVALTIACAIVAGVGLAATMARRLQTT